MDGENFLSPKNLVDPENQQTYGADDINMKALQDGEFLFSHAVLSRSIMNTASAISSPDGIGMENKRLPNVVAFQNIMRSLYE